MCGPERLVDGDETPRKWGTLAYFMSCRWYSIWPVVSVAPS